MFSKRLGMLLVEVAAFGGIVVAADAPGIHLVRDGGTDQIDPLNNQLRRGLNWSHGAYIFEDNLAGEPPMFYTLDRDGTWVHTARFEYSGAGRFLVYAFDRMSDGTVMFAGGIETAPRAVSPFIAWISSDGHLQGMTPTGDYLPRTLAVGPDDTIWTLGYEVDQSDPDWQIKKEANVLRHFDRSGKLIGSEFPYSEFRHSTNSLASSVGRLAVSRDRIGWYGGIGSKSVYVEIALPSLSIKAYPGAPTKAVKTGLAVGFAISSSGVASVSIENDLPSARTNYILDRPASKWVPVEVPPMGGFKFAPILIGSDEEDLVFQYAREAQFYRVER